MKVVTNIKKITSAMKMVAAAKLRRSQEALELARDFAKAVTAAWPDPKAVEGAEKKTEDGRKKGLIAITSDRGLCGSVNSVIIRDVKRRMADPANVAAPPQLYLIGEKGRIALERGFANRIGWGIGEQSKLKRFTFRQAAIIADLLASAKLADSTLLYNYFKSLLAFETRAVNWFSLESGTADPNTFGNYDVEGDDDFFENFYHFRNAARLYHFMAETETSELSSRMNAMGGSAKNAGEMLDSLRLQYNRTRQARITTELIEIISGAVALDD